MAITENEFCTVDEAAIIFGVHRNTIRRAISKGFLVAIRVGDGKKSPYRISRRSIEAIHESIIIQHSIKGKKNV